MPSHGLDEEEDKPCRACTDFNSWAKNQSKSISSEKNKEVPSSKESSKECPLDKDELGRATWGFLHSMASYYPVKPTSNEAESMTKFLTIFGKFYPCEPCALDYQEDIKKNPPKTKSRDELAKWLCERHNIVNVKLGKPVFDCSKVHERWKDGWADGSCD